MAEAILTGSMLLSDCTRLLLSMQASTRAAEGGRDDHNGYPKLSVELTCFMQCYVQTFRTVLLVNTVFISHRYTEEKGEYYTMESGSLPTLRVMVLFQQQLICMHYLKWSYCTLSIFILLQSLN